MKYRYILAGKTGSRALWTGIFETLEAAEKWYQRWGEFHRKRGKDLVLIETTSNIQ